MEEGCFKTVGRDRRDRPIICITARMWQPGRFAPDLEEEFVTYLLDTLENNMTGDL